VDSGGTEEFKKELKVKFENEEGIDEGGVKKEFFQLIFEQLLDPQFGMFVENPETRRYWINHVSLDLDEFKLIGILIGLAIYNGVILDVAFPIGLYKKLMGSRLSFADLESVNPVCLSVSLPLPLMFNTETDSLPFYLLHLKTTTTTTEGVQRSQTDARV